jgi:DNA polymerase-3 subunit beta
LAHAAGWVAKIAPSKPGNPVLAGVLLRAGESLSLQACDYETFGSAAMVGAVVHEPGTAVVSARLLAEVAKVIPAKAEVTLLADGSRMAVTAGRSRWALPELDPEAWPHFPVAPGSLGTVDGAEFGRALDRVLPAVSNDEARRVLTGVRVEFAPETVSLVATDTYRLARATIPWDGGQEDVSSLIVPAEMLRHATVDGPVAISQDGSVVTVSTRTRVVSGRLLAGEYPKYATILSAPEEAASERKATIVTVGAPELRAVVDGAAVVLGEHGHIRLAFADGTCGVRPAGDNRGDADSDVDLVDMAGPAITVAVAHRFLRDALACLEAPQARLTFTARATAGFLLQPVTDGEVDGDYRHILMPLNIARATR